MIPGRENSFDLPLPTRLKVAVAENFEPVIQVCVCVHMFVHCVYIYACVIRVYVYACFFVCFCVCCVCLCVFVYVCIKTSLHKQL